MSVGGWAAMGGDFGLEFVICTASAEDRAVELLAMTVFYNHGGKLNVGHTLPIGEPWLPGSGCDHLLVCVPYPFGPDLQTCHVGDLHVEFLWLLPITEPERSQGILWAGGLGVALRRGGAEILAGRPSIGHLTGALYVDGRVGQSGSTTFALAAPSPSEGAPPAVSSQGHADLPRPTPNGREPSIA